MSTVHGHTGRHVQECTPTRAYREGIYRGVHLPRHTGRHIGRKGPLTNVHREAYREEGEHSLLVTNLTLREPLFKTETSRLQKRAKDTRMVNGFWRFDKTDRFEKRRKGENVQDSLFLPARI